MMGEIPTGLLVIAGVAIVGGAVAFGAWSLLPDTWRPARWPVAIVVALMTALNFVSMSSRLPDAETELLRDPDTRDLARAWKDADPNGFSAFVEHVRDVESGSSDGSPSLSLAFALHERMPHLSDVDIVAFERNTRDLLLQYAQANPRLCAPLVQGGRVSLSDRAAMREIFEQYPTLLHQRLAVISNAFRADLRQPISVMTDDERRAALTAIGSSLRQNFSQDDILLLGPRASIVGHEKRYCEVMAAYEDALASSPDAGRLFRSLMQVRGTNL